MANYFMFPKLSCWIIFISEKPIKSNVYLVGEKILTSISLFCKIAFLLITRCHVVSNFHPTPDPKEISYHPIRTVEL